MTSDALDRAEPEGAQSMNPGEIDKLVRRFNDTARDYPADGLIHVLFEEQAMRTPDAVATTESGRLLTYRELDRRSNSIAHALVECGVAPDATVGLYAQRSTDAVVGMLAILKAGGAYVPLDPNYPRERLALMLTDSAPLVVLAPAGARGLTDLGVRLIPL